MANGGGPACLRLRVVADPATVDPRFLADEAKLDRIAAVVAAHWPEAIAPGDLASTALAGDVRKARTALLAEEIELRVEPVQHLLGSENPAARRRQFERQRQPFQPHA